MLFFFDFVLVNWDWSVFISVQIEVFVRDEQKKSSPGEITSTTLFRIKGMEVGINKTLISRSRCFYEITACVEKQTAENRTNTTYLGGRHKTFRRISKGFFCYSLRRQTCRQMCKSYFRKNQPCAGY